MTDPHKADIFPEIGNLLWVHVLNPNQKISLQEVEELKDWVRSEAKNLSDEKASMLMSMLEMVSILLKDKTTQKKAIETLRQLMGILPKSERGKTDRFDLPESGDKKPKEDLTEKQKLERQIKNLLNKYNRMYGRKTSQHRHARNKRKARNNPRHSGEEDLYHRTNRTQASEVFPLRIERAKEFMNTSGLRSSVDKRIRYDFSIVIKEMILEVETVTDPRTGQVVSASTTKFGPEGWQITWNAMANLVHLVVVFAMPAHRAAAYLGNDKGTFGESTILRVIQYVAASCSPVYLETVRQLAQSRRVQGDDSSTRVLGVEKQLRDDPLLKEEESHEGEAASKDADRPNLKSEIKKIDAVLGYQFMSKSGKPKKKIQVTMATGRIDQEDQFSQISVVRSHLGSFGNLVDKLLQIREAEKVDLLIQSDLSTANLATDTKHFAIYYAGCLAHSRRPFWRYRDVDPLNCYQMLRGFMLLSMVEDIIDCKDRTEETTNYWRGKYSRKIWNLMRSRCEKMMEEHMPNSELHGAAQYLVRNFEKLTYYLTDSWVNPTNNLVERILRAERTMLNNSKFRQSKNGRVAYDIIRTIQLCCAGARVQFLDYMNWYLPKQAEASRNPSAFTPYAYRKIMQAQPKS